MLQKTTISSVFAIFCLEPTRPHYLKELSRRTQIAHTSVATALSALVRSKLIARTLERRGSRSFPFYTAIHEEPFLREKRGYNIARLYETGLVASVVEKAFPSCIVLFGSYDRGEDIEGSDIDLFLEGTVTPADLLSYEKALGRKISVLVRKSFAELPATLKNNIVNGTVLAGYLEAFHDAQDTTRSRTRTSVARDGARDARTAR